MSVYNGQATLAEAMDSILQQTLPDFEFIIIDDGSTDASPALLADFAARDARIIIITQANQGLTAALNLGLTLARGRYIARMDADDISLPERFMRQVALLDARQDIGVCGTAMRYFGGREGEIHYETDPEIIRCSMLFQPPLAHPTVMLRKAAFEGLHYNPAYRRAQDYDLWMRAAEFTNMTNLPDVLLLYRAGESQISAAHRAEQLATTGQIYTAKLRQIGLDPTPAELEIHQLLFTNMYPREMAVLRQIDAWLQKLYRANQASRVYPEAAFGRVLAERWLRCCRSCAPLGIRVGLMYLRSPLVRYVSASTSAKLLARCVLRRKP